MPHIKPFSGLRYDNDRVDLLKVLAPAGLLDGPARSELEEREPRNIVRLTTLPVDDVSQTRAQFFLAQWLLARVLTIESEPSFYAIRQQLRPSGAAEESAAGESAAEAEVWERVGVLGALVVDGNEHADITLPQKDAAGAEQQSAWHSPVQSEPVTLLYRDAKHRVVRALENEMDERDPDAQVVIEDVVTEVWVIDDETTVGRIGAQLAQTQAVLVAGQHAYLSAQECARKSDTPESLLVYLCADDAPCVGVLRNDQPLETATFLASLDTDGEGASLALAHPLARGLVLLDPARSLQTESL